MKKLLILTAVFASLLAGFTACKDDDTIILDPNVTDSWPEWYAIGEFSYNPEDNNYYFKTIDCEEETLFKRLKDKIVPVSNVSTRRIPNIDQYVGNVKMILTRGSLSIDQDSLNFVSITRIENEGRFVTPEFDTPPPAWLFEPVSSTSSDNTK